MGAVRLSVAEEFGEGLQALVSSLTNIADVVTRKRVDEVLGKLSTAAAEAARSSHLLGRREIAASFMQLRLKLHVESTREECHEGDDDRADEWASSVGLRRSDCRRS